jgi:hypothetical protein
LIAKYNPGWRSEKGTTTLVGDPAEAIGAALAELSLPAALIAGAPHLEKLVAAVDPYLKETYRLRLLFENKKNREEVVELMMRQNLKEPLPRAIWRDIVQDCMVSFERITGVEQKLLARWEQPRPCDGAATNGGSMASCVRCMGGRSASRLSAPFGVGQLPWNHPQDAMTLPWLSFMTCSLGKVMQGNPSASMTSSSTTPFLSILSPQLAPLAPPKNGLPSLKNALGLRSSTL